MEDKKVSKKRIVLVSGIIIAIIVIAILIVVGIITNKGTEESTITLVDLELNEIGITQDPESSWCDDITIIRDSSMKDDAGETVTMYVPVPEGYVVSSVDGENTVKDGLVIYEGQEEVNDNNVDDAKTSRNQWVWIPVDPREVYWTDADGLNYGISHTFSSNGVEEVNEKLEPNIWNSEPYYYEDLYMDKYVSDNDSLYGLYEDMQVNFNEMIESIEKFGGFYIGRYELGGSVNEPTEVMGQTTIASTTWYKLYDACENFTVNETYQTSMIWGTLWDNTLIWLVESGDKTYDEIVDSRSWGNFKDSTGDAEKNCKTKRKSGYSEGWKAGNIYDLAGNIYEWTCQTKEDTEVRWSRGGMYSWSGETYSASSSINYIPSYSGVGVGTRPILYLK